MLGVFPTKEHIILNYFIKIPNLVSIFEKTVLGIIDVGIDATFQFIHNCKILKN